ncbi:hypothetical protein ACLB1R_04435 [Escherichia coli]
MIDFLVVFLDEEADAKFRLYNENDAKANDKVVVFVMSIHKMG